MRAVGIVALHSQLGAHAQAEFSGATSKKKRRLQSGSAELAGSVSLDGLVEGKTRADACCWFFEVLVLKSRDFVELEQPKSYGDISIRPTSRLLAAQ
jgi:cohesin complex subunit SCC1